jgi:hypothetical protein
MLWKSLQGRNCSLQSPAFPPSLEVRCIYGVSQVDIPVSPFSQSREGIPGTAWLGLYVEYIHREAPPLQIDGAKKDQPGGWSFSITKQV